jgi:hypothetical protein
LGRGLRHLVNKIHDLTAWGVGLKVLTGQGAAIDTATPAGKLVCGIFAARAERELISERTVAGLAPARARGRKGGRPFTMTAAKLRLATAAMGQPETQVGRLCEELGVTRQTLYRHVSPKGELRPDGKRLLSLAGGPGAQSRREPGGGRGCRAQRRRCLAATRGGDVGPSGPDCEGAVTARPASPLGPAGGGPHRWGGAGQGAGGALRCGAP